MTKMSQTHTGEKKASSTNGAGIAGYPHAEEEVRSVSITHMGGGS